MNKTLSLLAVFSLAVTAYCGKPSSKEFLADFGKHMCYKVAECAGKQMESMPEEQKKMAMAMIPQKKDCDDPESRFSKEFQTQMHTEKELTGDQISAGQKCLEAVKKASCSDMENSQLSDCEAFEKAMSM